MADLQYSADRCTFSLRLYKHLFTSKNFLISPLSAEIAILMAYIGANGKTRQEIADVLGLNAQYTVEKLSASFAQMKTDERKKPEPYDAEDDEEPEECYKMYMANGAFVSDRIGLNKQYTEELVRPFEANCIPVDFLEQEAAAKCINGFIEEHTKGIIQDVVSPADVTSDTVLVLASALCFKANWWRQFSEVRTTKKPFTTASGKSVLVDTMHTTTMFNYCKSKELGGAKILQMRYFRDSCCAYFILPGKKDGLFRKRSSDQGLSSLIKLLTLKRLLDAINSLHPVQYMKVQMLKFKTEQSLDMEQVLKDLGMATVFSPKQADFSGICQSSLSISKVRQKAYVVINEKGTEAAAATVVVMEICGPRPDTKGRFIADRPFLFFIRHDASNTFLYMGHVSDPSSP